MKVPGDRAVYGNKRLDKAERQIVACDWLEDSILVCPVQVQAPWGIAAEVDACQYFESGVQLQKICRLTAGYGTEFVLLDQAIPKIRAQLQAVRAEEARIDELLLRAELPRVRGDKQGVVSAVLLTGVDRAAGDWNSSRDQAGHEGESIVAESKQSKLMMS